MEKVVIFMKIKKMLVACTKTIENIVNKISRLIYKDELLLDDISIKKISICLLLIVVLIFIMIFSSLIGDRQQERKNFDKVDVNDFVNNDLYINLDARINNEIHNFDLIVPKNVPSNEDIIKRILYVVNDDLVKGDNLNLKNVTSKLYLPITNSYNAEMKWESKFGYINVDSGDVIRPFKNQGSYKDVLTLTVEYKGIKMSKEFYIVILEDKYTVEEMTVKKTCEKIKSMSSQNELFKVDEYAFLPNTIDNANVDWYYPLKEKKKDKNIIIVLMIVLAILSIINTFYTSLQNKKVKISKLECQFIDFAEYLLLLEKANFNIANSIKYIYSKRKKNDELGAELSVMNNKLFLSENPYVILDEFADRTQSIIIKRYITNLIVNLKRGNKNIDTVLNNELKLLNENKVYLIVNKAKQNNLKTILPLIMILISCMIMVVYPAIVYINF